MDGRDHQLVAGFDLVADLGQRRRLGRLAELADVGAGDEVGARARDHDGVHVGVVAQFGKGLLQALAHRGAQRVHRRVVQGDQGDGAVALDANGREGVGMGGHGLILGTGSVLDNPGWH